MSASVWVYPERKFEQLGAVRYKVSWEEVKPEAVGKDDIDPDRDICYLVLDYRNKAKAIARAKKIIAAGITAFGAVTVTKQIVDWFVEEDRIAEWADTSESEEVSS